MDKIKLELTIQLTLTRALARRLLINTTRALPELLAMVTITLLVYQDHTALTPIAAYAHGQAPQRSQFPPYGR